MHLRRQERAVSNRKSPAVRRQRGGSKKNNMNVKLKYLKEPVYFLIMLDYAKNLT